MFLEFILIHKAARDSRKKNPCDFADVCRPLSDIRCLMSEDCCLYVCLSVCLSDIYLSDVSYLTSAVLSVPLFAVCCLTSCDIFCLMSAVYCLMSAVCCLHIFDMLCLLLPAAVFCLMSLIWCQMSATCLLIIMLCLLSAVCCLLSDARCLLSFACCLMSDVCCLRVFWYILSAICYLLSDASYLTPDVCCLISFACCLLFMSVVCCLHVLFWCQCRIHALCLMLNRGKFCL